jgi:hypothetical protein
MHEKIDVVLFLIRQFNQSNKLVTLKSMSPFSLQMSVNIPEYYNVMEKTLPSTNS